LYLKARDGVVLIRTRTTLGSGFLVTERLVATNYHVIQDGRRIRVTSRGGKTAIGKVVACSRKYDLALVKIKRRLPNTHPLTLADELPAKGNLVVTVGHPYGTLAERSPKWAGLLRWSWSMGVLIKSSRHVVQTNAAVYGGNSGGPVIDHRGKVIGVVSYTPRNASMLAFGIHVRHLRRLMKRKRTGYVRSWKIQVAVGVAASVGMDKSYSDRSNVQFEGLATLDELQLGILVGRTLAPTDAFKGKSETRPIEVEDTYVGGHVGYRWILPIQRASVAVTLFTGFIALYRSTKQAVMTFQRPGCIANCPVTLDFDRSKPEFHVVIPAGIRVEGSIFFARASFRTDVTHPRQSSVDFGAGLVFSLF
jgi:hypothetical protein